MSKGSVSCEENKHKLKHVRVLVFKGLLELECVVCGAIKYRRTDGIDPHPYLTESEVVAARILGEL